MSGNRNFKATLFTHIFNEPDKILELYNALSGKELPPETPIKQTTLEDVLFMDRINDLAFVVDGRLVVLIEHQSTINENMPLRVLIYLSRVYERIVDNKTIYRTSLVEIPRPEFCVLYNGKDDYVDRTTLKLSDAFMENPDRTGFGSALELEVPIININKGHNADVIQKSIHLNGYVTYVSKVREYQAAGLKFQDALASAAKDCIKNDILIDILPNLSSEVLNMLMVEFNLEDALSVRMEEGIEKGIRIGEARGEARGIAQGAEQKTLELAGKLLALGMEAEQISEVTGLSVGQVMALR